MDFIKEEETDDLAIIYHRGGLDAVYQAGRADGINDIIKEEDISYQAACGSWECLAPECKPKERTSK